MISVYKKLWFLLSPSEQTKFLKTLFIMMLSSLLESSTILLIYPFMQVFNQTSNDPGTITAFMIKLKNIHSSQFPGLYLFLFMGSFIFISYSVTLFSKWLLQKFIWFRTYSFHKKTIKSYLGKKYEFYLRRDISELSKNILNEIAIFVNGLLYPVMEMTSQLFTTTIIVLTLVTINPTISIIAFIFIGGSYFLINKIISTRIIKSGSNRIKSNEDMYKGVHQIFGSIKEIKARGDGHLFSHLLTEPSREYAKTNLSVGFLTIAPRYALEFIIISFFIVYIWYVNKSSIDLAEQIPTLTIFALSGLKIIPFIQNIYASRTKVKYNLVSLDKIISDLDNPYDAPVESDLRILENQNKIFSKNIINLNNLSYIYPGTNKKVLDGISLSIEKDTFVAFVGETGSGKTTLIDLIVGLLTPTEGEIKLRDKIVGESIPGTSKNIISYVPQETFILNEDLYTNISLDLRNNQREENYKRFLKVLKKTKLEKLYSKLNDYQKLGERGLKISGGEKQRIGIARGLFRDPQILVLDESTSALDKNTEMKIVEKLTMIPDLTIIAITHNINILSKCKIIYKISDGKIKNKGTYEQINRIL